MTNFPKNLIRFFTAQIWINEEKKYIELSAIVDLSPILNEVEGGINSDLMPGPSLESERKRNLL